MRASSDALQMQLSKVDERRKRKGVELTIKGLDGECACRESNQRKLDAHTMHRLKCAFLGGHDLSTLAVCFGLPFVQMTVARVITSY
jgi:hypothetical protein